MDSLAAARRGKRRKLEAPESPEYEGDLNISPLPVPSTSAPDSSNPPGSGTGGDEPYIQDPPPGAEAGGEEEDRVDRISHLPDAILGEVISLLPTKDAACTRILATRWRHLWRSAPLNLDVDDGNILTVDVVSLILSAHRGPGRRFRFPAQQLQDHPATMDAWLQCPALDNLQEIDFFTTDGFRVLPPPPASAFRFSSSLCVATFGQCHLSDDFITQELQFPRLKKLALEWVVISEDSLHNIIAASPVLEGLLLRRIIGCRCVRINSASLTSIGVSNVYYRTMTCLEEFIVEDAPCLKRIVYLQSPQMGTELRVSVISAPNLETLGCLSYAHRVSSRLTLGSMIIQPCCIKNFWVINTTPPACTVKILAVCISTLSLDVIIDLMRLFPCLEKLYIQPYCDGDKNLWRRKHRNLIKGLDILLKIVVLNKYYRGIQSQVNFATFFVLNAKILESMTFQCRRHIVTAGFLAEQRRLLLDKRTSRRARFCFATKGCHHDFLHINHAHDLSIRDPFECVEAGDGACLSFE